MGDVQQFQPLTQEDKITVVLYRTGIVLSTLSICLLSYALLNASRFENDPAVGMKFTVLLLVLYFSAGLSVFFIHLYVSRFHRTLKKVYSVAVLSCVVLLYLGKGDALQALAHTPFAPLLLIPLAGCIGFVTAKEAFCFKLTEGYLIAMLMPLYLLSFAIGGMSLKGASLGLIIIAVLLVLFTLRKAFQPIHYDIGDKSAYT